MFSWIHAVGLASRRLGVPLSIEFIYEIVIGNWKTGTVTGLQVRTAQYSCVGGEKYRF